MPSIKLSLFYDILCPRSWVFYQVLQKKFPLWRAYRQFTIEYLPVNSNFIQGETHGVIPAGMIASKKAYMLQELYDICDFYNLPKGDFEVTYENKERRSRTALLLLNRIRRTRPEYYRMFMERMFYGFWHNSEKFTHTSHFFKLGRELGVNFAEMDRIVMHIEEKENSLDIYKRGLYLTVEERIASIPWFRVDSVPGNEKLIGFTEIIRLELMDELMAQPFFNPLNHSVNNPLYNLNRPADDDGDGDPERKELDEYGLIRTFWKRKVKAKTG